MIKIILEKDLSTKWILLVLGIIKKIWMKLEKSIIRGMAIQQLESKKDEMIVDRKNK